MVLGARHASSRPRRRLVRPGSRGQTAACPLLELSDREEREYSLSSGRFPPSRTVAIASSREGLRPSCNGLSLMPIVTSVFRSSAPISSRGSSILVPTGAIAARALLDTLTAPMGESIHQPGSVHRAASEQELVRALGARVPQWPPWRFRCAPQNCRGDRVLQPDRPPPTSHQQPPPGQVSAPRRRRSDPLRAIREAASGKPSRAVDMLVADDMTAIRASCSTRAAINGRHIERSHDRHPEHGPRQSWSVALGTNGGCRITTTNRRPSETQVGSLRAPNIARLPTATPPCRPACSIRLRSSPATAVPCGAHNEMCGPIVRGDQQVQILPLPKELLPPFGHALLLATERGSARVWACRRIASIRSPGSARGHEVGSSRSIESRTSACACGFFRSRLKMPSPRSSG